MPNKLPYTVNYIHNNIDYTTDFLATLDEAINYAIEFITPSKLTALYIVDYNSGFEYIYDFKLHMFIRRDYFGIQ